MSEFLRQTALCMLSLSRTRATCQKWRAPASRREAPKRRRAAPLGATGRRRKQVSGVIWASRCRLTQLASKVSAVSDLRLLVVKLFLCKTGRAVGLDREGVSVTEGAQDRWPLPPSPRVFCLSIPAPATASCMHAVHAGRGSTRTKARCTDNAAPGYSSRSSTETFS